MAESESDKLARMVASGFDEVHKRFDSIDGRLALEFEEVRDRFSAVDKRFDGMDKRFDRMDRRFASIQETMVTGFKELRDEIRAGLADHGQRLGALEARQGRGRRS